MGGCDSGACTVTTTASVPVLRETVNRLDRLFSFRRFSRSL